VDTSGRLAQPLGTAVVLPTGDVLVLGATPSGDALPNVERFDPGTRAWTELPSLHVARESHTATLLPNELVLVVGGDAPGSAASVELYDPNVPG
jgi:large repetitive protein